MAALFAAGIAESLTLRGNLARIPVRVLVNGTRGKSQVTRLVAAALREAGFKTIAKTTGSAAMLIMEDGSETPVSRPRGARITEQTGLARLAARRKADALVVECMAVRPDSQEAMRRHLVRPTLTLITNARVDHVEEMGPVLEDTVAALKRSVDPESALITCAEGFEGAATNVIRARADEEIEAEALGMPFHIFPENLALAIAASSELGVDRKTALRGMAKAAPDPGALRVFELAEPGGEANVDAAASDFGPRFDAPHSIWFVNAFAANDLESTVAVWEEASAALPADIPVVLAYNNRADREYRLREFAGLPASIGAERARLVIVLGENAAKAARRFSKSGLRAEIGPPAGKASARRFPAEFLSQARSLVPGPFIIFGAGNIKGPGLELAWYFQKSGREIRLGRVPAAVPPEEP